MRRLLNKLLKKEKKEQSHLDAEILKSSEFKALQNMNYIMNFYSNIEQIDKVKFDPMEGDELYIEARFAANNFLSSLVEKISKEVAPVETNTTLQSKQTEGALVVSES